MLRVVLHFHPAENASNKTKSLTVLRNMEDEDVYTKNDLIIGSFFLITGLNCLRSNIGLRVGQIVCKYIREHVLSCKHYIYIPRWL